MTGADLRAAGILVVLLVYGVVALPLPKTLAKKTFENPVAVEELARWTEVLGGVGVQTSPTELRDGLLTAGSLLGGTKAAVLQPVKPWLRLTGTGQAWGLFTYPDTFPHRLVIEGRSDLTTWRTLYAGLDDDADFMREVLTYRRVRGVYDGNTTTPGDSWNNFSKWAAYQALDAFPDLVEVRVGFRRFHTIPPGGVPDPEVVTRHLRVYRRDSR